MSIDWNILFFIAIPEAFVMALIGLAALGMPIKKNIGRIIIFTLLDAVIVFLLRDINQYQELHYLFNVTIFLLLTSIVFRLPVVNSFLLTIIAYFAVAFFEFIIFYVFYILFGNIEQLMSNPTTYILLFYTYLIPLAITAILISRSRYKLDESMLQTKKAYALVIFLLGIIQIILLLSFFNIVIRLETDQIGSPYRIPLYLLFIMISIFISFAVLRRWYTQVAQQELIFTETTYQKQFHSMVISMRSHSHDMNNHLIIIHGLIQQGHFDSAKSYINTLINEVQATNMSMNMNDPVLAVLLFSKNLEAQKHHVDFKFRTETKEVFDKIKQTDMIRLMSNLIDNALEATIEMPQEERKVHILLMQEKDYHLIEVINSGQAIKDKKKLFKSNFSTKELKNGQNKRGYGISIIKEITAKYGGEVSYQLKDKLNQFTVKIPR